MEAPATPNRKDLSKIGLQFTPEEMAQLGYYGPSDSETQTWLTHNGLKAEPGKVVKVTVNGEEKMMQLDPNDFGTIVVPEKGKTVEETLKQRHLSVMDVLGS